LLLGLLLLLLLLLQVHQVPAAGRVTCLVG
jgi:hypothetical protein